MYALFACILKALSVLTSGSVGVTFADPVCSQVPEFVRYPVSEGIIAHIAVAVDEHRPAGQMREHGACISGGDMKEESFGGNYVFPMGHKDNSQRKNFGLHDLDLSANQCFLSCRSSQDGVAICGSSRCSGFCNEQD